MTTKASPSCIAFHLTRFNIVIITKKIKKVAKAVPHIDGCFYQLVSEHQSEGNNRFATVNRQNSLNLAHQVYDQCLLLP